MLEIFEKDIDKEKKKFRKKLDKDRKKKIRKFNKRLKKDKKLKELKK